LELAEGLGSLDQPGFGLSIDGIGEQKTGYSHDIGCLRILTVLFNLGAKRKRMTPRDPCREFTRIFTTFAVIRG
jgi:hypothetical protein